MAVYPLRPAQVDLSEQEARAVAAAIDLAIVVSEANLNGGERVDLAALRQRFVNAAEIAKVERMLGRK